MINISRLFLVAASVALSAPALAAAQDVSPEAAATAPAPAEGAEAPVRGLEPIDPAIYAEVFSSRVTAGGLTARDVASRAVETAPSVARGRASLRAAEAQADVSVTNFLPRLDVTASYTRLSEVTLPSLGGGGIDPATLAAFESDIAMMTDPAAQRVSTGFLQAFQAATSGFTFPVILDQWALRAQLSYPVTDLFLTILPAYEATEGFADVERLRLEAERRNVDLRAREAFFNHVRAQATLAVAEATAAQSEANRTQVQALVQAGVAPRVDLMRVEAASAAARVGVARSDGAVQITGHVIRTLLHESGGRGALPIGENLAENLPDVRTSRADFVARALDRRAELRALDRLVAAQSRLADVQSGRRFPRLLLTGQAEYSNPNQRIIPSRQEFDGTWAVGAAIAWSPNDTANAQLALSQTEAQVEQARADLESLRDAIRIEVEQSYENYVAARSSLEAAAAGLQAATEAYRVRQEELDAGTAVARDLVDAEADLTRSRIDLVNAIIDLRIAHARLARAVEEQ